jgi:hypothetical protein
MLSINNIGYKIKSIKLPKRNKKYMKQITETKIINCPKTIKDSLFNYHVIEVVAIYESVSTYNVKVILKDNSGFNVSKDYCSYSITSKYKKYNENEHFLILDLIATKTLNEFKTIKKDIETASKEHLKSVMSVIKKY